MKPHIRSCNGGYVCFHVGEPYTGFGQTPYEAWQRWYKWNESAKRVKRYLV